MMSMSGDEHYDSIQLKIQTAKKALLQQPGDPAAKAALQSAEAEAQSYAQQRQDKAQSAYMAKVMQRFQY